jgi:hypothetical protein
MMIILVQYHPLFCWPGQKGSYTLPYFFCHQPLAMHAGSLSEEHGWKLEIKSKLGPPGEEVKPFLLGRCLVSAGPWLVLLPTSSAFPRATTCQRTVARESRRRCEAEMKQEHATSCQSRGHELSAAGRARLSITRTASNTTVSHAFFQRSVKKVSFRSAGWMGAVPLAARLRFRQHWASWRAEPAPRGIVVTIWPPILSVLWSPVAIN